MEPNRDPDSWAEIFKSFKIVVAIAYSIALIVAACVQYPNVMQVLGAIFLIVVVVVMFTMFVHEIRNDQGGGF